MKKLGLILTGFFITFLLVGTAQAVKQVPLADGDYNGLYFINWENFINNETNDQNPAGTGNNVIDVGDQFYGVYLLNSIAAPSSPDGVSIPNWFPTNFEVTGFFASEVTKMTYISAGFDLAPGTSDDIYLIEFGPLTGDPSGFFTTTWDLNGADPGGSFTASDYLDWSNNEMLAIFTDASKTLLGEYNPADPTLYTPDGLLAATDGDEVWRMGYDTTNTYDGDGTTPPEGYFYTVAELGITPESQVTTTNAGFKMYMGPDTALIYDTNEHYYQNLYNGGSHVLVDLWLNTDLTVNATPDGSVDPTDPDFAFWVKSNDPAVIHPVTAIPEPASMLLLGTGLVGLAGASRRRKKSDKKS